MLDTSMLAVPRGAVRRQPDPHRHPRLPRRARRRARGHLRRPVAGADRGARRDDRAAAADVRRRSARADRSTGSAWRSPSSARSSSRRSAAKRARIPQEAIIGICYAVASAAAILAMSKATSESEHLKDMLVGNILAVSWPEVGKTAALYGAIGALPLRVPQAVPRDLDGPSQGRGSRGSTSGSGTSCSTPRSASSSPRRCRSPACCSCSAI